MLSDVLKQSGEGRGILRTNKSVRQSADHVKFDELDAVEAESLPESAR